MSAPSMRPGPQSLVALHWMSRVGAAPGEPIALVMGWSIRAMHDHVARLVRAGLVRRVPMTRGHGSLIVITAEGARMAGDVGTGAPRNVAPTSWAHTVACAWVAAWFEVRQRPWVSSREISQRDEWTGRVIYQDGYGRTQRVRHHPDIGTYLGQPARPVAVEVELQRKSAARLRGILRMYAQRTADATADLGGVVYVTANTNVAKGIRAAATAVEFAEHPAGQLRLLALDDVIAQTRTVALKARTARIKGGHGASA